MKLRTDLAIEANELSGNIPEGISVSEETRGGIRITKMHVNSQNAAKRLGKPVGKYITADGFSLTDQFRDVKEKIMLISHSLREMLPENGLILVAGLGNTSITPDALGPECISHILATRHISGDLAVSTGLGRLRSVAAISPGVTGQTGIETGEIISGLVRSLSPAAVLVIDALAARSLSRLGSTIQICDTGIAPGSGVGNHRMIINKETIGVPVISVGVPTVVDASTLALDIISGIGDLSDGTETLTQKGAQMMVTPREVDLLIERASKIVGMSVNCALQPQYDFDTLAALVS